MQPLKPRAFVIDLLKTDNKQEVLFIYTKTLECYTFLNVIFRTYKSKRHGYGKYRK